SWSTGISSDNQIFGNGSYEYDKNSIWSNVGDMVNLGWETDIHAVLISKSKFSWKTDFNISINTNKIKSLTGELDESGKGLIHSDAPTVSRTGFKRRVWYLADYAGVDPQTGVPMIYVVDKEEYEETGNTNRLKDSKGKDSLTYATKTNLEENRFYQNNKSGDPSFYGGLKNTLKYGHFDLSFFIAFSGGNYIMDYDRQISTAPNETRMVLAEVMDKAWKRKGDIAEYPQIRARGTYIINGTPVTGFDNSDVYFNRELYKGDYLRLRNIELGYNLPDFKLKSYHLSSLRIYLQASNVFTWTKYPGFDPEGVEFVYYSSIIPQVRSIVFGLNASF
ncbi:MAG: hypothetical protein HC906_14115, partial [Bacteroidales bacterium]|nr:hypothetical protein [Bacteroidales bacterium]